MPDLELYRRGRIWWVRGTRPDTERYVRESLGTSDQALAEAKLLEIYEAALKRRRLGADAPQPADELSFAALVLLYQAPERDRRYLLPITRRIGKLKRAEITPESVRRLARELYPEASTDTWQRQVISPVRSVINNAHELGKVPPIRIRAFTKAERTKQDLARGKQSRVPRSAGSWDWLLKFVAVADPRDAALAWFMFRHGYRLGQSAAMTRSADMDLSAGRVRVHASKGHPAHWVDLDPEEVAMIANLQPPKSVRKHSRAVVLDRVFYIADVRCARFYARWKAACAKAGIAYLPPHSSGRHGYGTEMVVRQQVDPVSAAANLWSNPSVMLSTYAHSPDAAAKVRDAFAAGRAAAGTQPVQLEVETHRKNA